MDPSCGVLKEYIVNPGTGHLYNPDGTPVGRLTGYVTVSPQGGFDRSGHQVVLTDSTTFQVTFPRPGYWTVEVTLEDTSGHRHTETRFVRYRPDWHEGWQEVSSMPAQPSNQPVKRGGWLARHESSGLVYAAKGNRTADFYSYDPVADTWSSLAGMPYGTHPLWSSRAPEKGSKGISDGEDLVYATQGNNSLGFWAYSIPGNSWQMLPDVPEGPRGKKLRGGTDMCHVVRDRVPYVYLLKGYGTEFYRFNIVADSWEVLPDAPTGLKPKWDKGSWLVYGGMTYLYAHKAKYYDRVSNVHEFYRFDTRLNRWDTLSGMPLYGLHGGRIKKKKAKDGGAGAMFEEYVFALKGGNTQQFWMYNTLADTWTETDTVPTMGTTGRKKRVKYGADLVHHGQGTFFALKGNKTREMWRYVVPVADPGGMPCSGRAGRLSPGRPAIDVLPNPVTRGLVPVRFTLVREGPALLSVYDPAGRLAHRAATPGARSGLLVLDLRELSAGVYLLKLEGDGETASTKLVLQR